MTREVTSPGQLDGRRYDVIIVGAGMSGSLLAKRLGDQGWRVLVLEAGVGGTETWPGYLDTLDTFHAADAKVPNSAYRPSAAAPSPNVLDLAPKQGGDGYVASGYFDQRGRLPYGTDYLRALGGTAMHWLGAVPRMHPTDFQTESRYGYGRDWPIDATDLQPFYAAAELELGVAGDAAEQREWVTDPDDPKAGSVIANPRYVYPMQKIPPSYIDEVFRRIDEAKITDPVGDQTVALHVTSLPQARNSTPNPAYGDGGYRPKGAVGLPNYGERCVGNASCTPICPVQAKWSPLRLQAGFGDRVTLATRCVVSRVLLGQGGYARGVEYRAYGDPATPVSDVYTATADIVILAAHAIENARLMLASDVAKTSGQLGRNLMDHPTLLAWGLVPDGAGQVGPFRGPGHTSGYENFRFGDARRRRSPFRIEISNWGWGWPFGAPFSNVSGLLALGGDLDGEVRPLGDGKFGPALRSTLGGTVGRQISLQIAVEQPADPDNTVTIDWTRLDGMGNPRPVLTYNLDKHVRDGVYAARQVSKGIFATLFERLDPRGGGRDFSDYGPQDGTYQVGHFRHRPGPAFPAEDLRYWGAGHGAGTHIMGDDPYTSVVNSWQRTHDHPNLYAVGCGSMPSIGTSNPSLTMVALTLRTADEVHRHLAALNRPVNLRTPGTSEATA